MDACINNASAISLTGMCGSFSSHSFLICSKAFFDLNPKDSSIATAFVKFPHFVVANSSFLRLLYRTLLENLLPDNFSKEV